VTAVANSALSQQFPSLPAFDFMLLSNYSSNTSTTQISPTAEARAGFQAVVQGSGPHSDDIFAARFESGILHVTIDGENVGSVYCGVFT
jgi:hypothetical protein